MKLGDRFERRYLESLGGYRFYYDDVCDYGCPDSASHVFYFIPGLNGAPGQIRFALPGILRAMGNRIYIRCLHLPEFSSSVPVWSKYTLGNLEKRHAKLRADLASLAQRHGRILVVASSTGFYDFAAVFESLSPCVRRALTLLWVAAAPDRIKPTRWESVFAPLNGIERNQYRWAALPNHNAFCPLNREARTTYRWRNARGAQVLYKDNLESRFRLFGLSWAYFSVECTNWVLRRCTEGIQEPLDIESYVLAAEEDGYWQGMSKPEMAEVIGRYLVHPQFLWKRASHLWINIPHNVHELMDLVLCDSLS